MRKALTRRDFLKVSGGALAGAYALTLVGCGEEAVQSSGGRPSAKSRQPIGASS